jgi:hypothetical protein
MSIETEYFDPSKFSIRKIEKYMAEEMITKYHYTHKWSLCQITYGIFHIMGESSFFDTTEEKLIGCSVFGQPVGRSAAESISSLIKIDEVLELTRLFIHDGYGKNIESYFISQSMKLIKRDLPHIKAIISYSDVEQGHKGTIYQACGFHYQGNSSLALMPNFSISLVGSPYKWMHSRTAFSTFGSHNVEHLKRKIGHTFWRKKEATKHRYFYLLGNKMEKRKMMTNLKHPCLPYPKDAKYHDEIEEIVVENNTENLFFS